MSWVVAGNTCSADASAQASGVQLGLINSAAQVAGSATFMCMNGNWGSATAATYETPPLAVTGLAFNTASITNNTQPILSWSAVTGATSFSVRINGGAWADVGNVTSYQLPTQTDGIKTLQVQANKLVGATSLASAASAVAVITIDTVAPILNSVSLNDWEGNFGTAGTAVFTMSESIANVTSVTMKFTTGQNIGAVVPGINLTSSTNANRVTVTPLTGSGYGTLEGVRIEITGTDAAGNIFTVTTTGFDIF